MGVVNDGHRDAGGSSYADDVFESGWSRSSSSSPRRASVGPLAQWDGSDPIKKTARVLGDDNNFESTSGPGANRVVQSPDPASEKNRSIDQSPADAKGPPPAAVATKNPAGSPSTGVKAPGASGSGAKPETSDAKVKDRVVSYMRQKESPPVPRDLFPAPVSPSWTGSGPQAALVSDNQKIAEPLPIDDLVDESSVDSALLYAGVPMHLRPGRLLRGAAELALAKVASSDAEYLVRGDIHPLKLVAMLDDFFGGEWRDWEPETIRVSLAKEAGADPSDSVMNKIMAVKIAMVRPEVFFERWQAFEKMAVSLNDRDPAMTVTEELDPEEIANAVTIMRKISGDGDFSPEVEAYVAARLHNSGFVVAPPQLSFADTRLGELVHDDGLRGKVILAYAQAVKGDMDVAESEDPVDIQVARLLRSHVYVLDRLTQGREQLGT